MFLVWPTKLEKYFEFYAKLICCLITKKKKKKKKKKGDCLKSKFWKIGFKTCVLEEHFISYSCIFISNIKCFELSFQKSGYFFKKAVFPEFQLIQSDFRSIEILFKKFSEPLPGSIDWTCFSINRTSWFKFFKNSVLTDSNIFSKLFQTFLSLSDLARLHWRFFVIFHSNFCKVFLSQGR